MKTVALIDVDLATTPLGTRSRLADPLDGVPVLRRTVQQALAAKHLASIVVAAPEAQLPTVRDLLAELPIRFHARSDGAPPYRHLVRTARKWSLDAWRGGLGGSSALDEYTDVRLARDVATEQHAGWVAIIPPAAAYLDPTLTDALIAHAVEHESEARMVFAQAPPGLLPLTVHEKLLTELAQANLPVGWTLTYQPNDPRIDLAFKPSCFAAPQEVRHARGRLLADTDRGWACLQALRRDGIAPDGPTVGRWLQDREQHWTDRLPREVEIELTTDDPLPETKLRPRGARVPARGPATLDWLASLAAELAQDDDRLVVLGGFGDPVLHPEFAACVHALHDAGVYGLGLFTTAQQLPDACCRAIVDAQVDVVAVHLDAWHADSYAELHGGANLDTARRAIDRLAKLRQDAGQTQPIIVPHFTKSRLNVGEMDLFFDNWLRTLGCATIAGYADCGGSLPDLHVVNMSPPQRVPCRRLTERCLVLADGTVTACDQDPAGTLALGHLGNTTMEAVWTGPRAQALRNEHHALNLAARSLCRRCREWHRP